MNLLTKQPVFIDTILPLPDTKALEVARDVILILSFSVVTAVCAKLKVEVGAVPITMQTFAVLLAGALLGSKRGALSQLTYLLMGLTGIPWFARGGGISYILSPTFGYLFGFVLAALSVGWLCERGFDRQVKTAMISMFVGNVLLYIPGLLWLAKFVGLGKVLSVGLFPFIFGDLLKIIMAGLLLPIGWKLIKRSESKIEY